MKKVSYKKLYLNNEKRGIFMNELQLRTTEMFGEVQTDIYENEYHEMFMTA